jgi:acyl-CoA hydrolase
MEKRETAKSPVRRISATEAANLVQSGMWLDYGGALGQPDVFDKALAACGREILRA